MRHGFVKVAAATPDIRVADVEFNKENICRGIEEAEKATQKILVFPELCVTGYTCSDLFDHAVLLKAAKRLCWRSQSLPETGICWCLWEFRLRWMESFTMWQQP